MNEPFVSAAIKTAEGLLWPFMGAAICCGILFGLISTTLPAQDSRYRWRSLLVSYLSQSAYCAGMAILGITTGFLAGNSRTAVVGDLLPALLSMVGALLAIFLSRETVYRRLALALSLALSVATLMGAILGAQQRYEFRNSEKAIARRADLVAICKVQELRARQMIELMSEAPADVVDLKCAEYPRE